jgi:hypothetical protein
MYENLRVIHIQCHYISKNHMYIKDKNIIFEMTVALKKDMIGCATIS